MPASPEPPARVARRPPPTYRERMSEGAEDAAEPDLTDMFDADAGPGLVCRVCGCLVAQSGSYPRAHWDWHEASNGA
jgi:hypothetical protein